MPTGLLVMIDGITGSGKTTIIRAMKDHLRSLGKTLFDLEAYSKEHRDPPIFEHVAEYDAFGTFEPTRTWVGAAIRFELSRQDSPYESHKLAYAFALDREIMYRRLILPALSSGKIVLQDRGVCSSIAFQPIMGEKIPLGELLDIPGNLLAMSRAPNHLILLDIALDTAMERLRARRNDDHKGVFEDPELLARVDERYRSKWFADLFRSRGTTIHWLDANGSIEENISRAHQLMNTILTPP